MENEFQSSLAKAMDEVWDRLIAEVEKLTKEQFIEALTQAIRSGDFMRFIHANYQAVTYEPFRKVQELKARISELEDEVAEWKAAYESYEL